MQTLWLVIQRSLGRYIWLWLFIISLGIAILLAPSPFAKAQVQPDSKKSSVYVLSIDNQMITGVTARYLQNGINQASAAKAKLVIVKLDTPGGLLSASHDMVKSILNAPVPVAVYVSPSGGRAGSAGVFITMAAHVAAMAPGTRIGAAHPVDGDGNWPAFPKQTGNDKSTSPTKEVLPDQQVMAEKIMNDTLSGIRSIALYRGRNAEWAVKAVTESASITADEAVKQNVVNFQADSLESVVQQANHRTVLVDGKKTMLTLKNPQFVPVTFTAQQQLMSILTNPMLAYLLLMIGFYGLVFEITHPGVAYPGVFGGISLILGLIGLQTVSYNMGGLGLVILGFALMVGELFLPTFGSLLVGGIICLVLGSVFLFQTGDPFLISMLPQIITSAVILIAIASWLFWTLLKTRHKPTTSVLGQLVGEIGRVVQPAVLGESGKAHVYGEIWDVKNPDGPLLLDEKIVVTGHHQDLTTVLLVKPYLQDLS